MEKKGINLCELHVSFLFVKTAISSTAQDKLPLFVFNSIIHFAIIYVYRKDNLEIIETRFFINKSQCQDPGKRKDKSRAMQRKNAKKKSRRSRNVISKATTYWTRFLRLTGDVRGLNFHYVCAVMRAMASVNHERVTFRKNVQWFQLT